MGTMHENIRQNRHSNRHSNSQSVNDICIAIREVGLVRSADLALEGVRLALHKLAGIQAWIDSQKITLGMRLEELSAASPAVMPEHVIASACSTSRAEARRDMNRARVLSALPELNQALRGGHITTAHVDVVARATQSLSTQERQQVLQQGEWLANVASHATPDNFSRAVKQAVVRLGEDAGVSRLEQQRRRAWLRHWVDRDSGMVCMHGEFDPESGLRLVGRLQRVVERLFHERTPDTCPDGSGKPAHLNALGLVALATSGGSSGTENPGHAGVTQLAAGHARAEISVVVDYRTLAHGLHRDSIVRTGTDIDLPVETVRRMACEAHIIPIVMGSGGVVLDMGRATRLASRHQRRALEAMHPTCAVPSCDVPISLCQPHHIDYWTAGGPTNLDNLVPLCDAHHRCVHEGGWKLTMHPGSREVRVTQPGARELLRNTS
jgi:Domain of unknown function (DUF222)